MEQGMKISAVILLGIAAYFWWMNNTEVAGLIGIVGAVLFFLSVRTSSKKRVDTRFAEQIAEQEQYAQLNEVSEIDDLSSFRETEKNSRDRF